MTMRFFTLGVFLLIFHPVITKAQIKCLAGWGDDRAELEIPAARIDDGYCDCPTSGADEPNTSACSGWDAWSGNTNPQESQSMTYFSCPHQPQLRLSLSKVNDGICDCCDGADELSSEDVDCPDICDEVLAAERSEREKLVKAFQAGSSLRNEKIREFEEMKAQIKANLTVKEQELNEQTAALETISAELQERKISYLMDRNARQMHLVETLARHSADSQGPVTGMLEALSNEELSWFIVFLCQLSGETPTSDTTNTATCTALRRAGIDAGILWDAQTYQVVRMDDDEKKALFANILDHNVRNSDESVWNQKGLELAQRKKRSKAPVDEEDIHYDYDDYDEYHSYDSADYGDDDVYDYGESARRPPPSSRYSLDKDGNNEKREQLAQFIKEQPFFLSRASFLAASEELLAKLNDRLEEKDDDKGSTEDDSRPDFDPMALNMVKRKLEKRRRFIEEGLETAVSGKALMDFFEDFKYDDMSEKRKDLERLAIGTLQHSRVSASDVGLIYHFVVDEISSQISSEISGRDTCTSPWAGLCPPTVVRRKESYLPPKPVVDEMEKACAAINMAESGQLACAMEASDLPVDTPPGFLGYYEVSSRTKDDLFASAFKNFGLSDQNPVRKPVNEKRDELDNVQSLVDSLEKEIKEMKKTIGEDGSDFGPDGELFGLKDSCFSVEEGKYEYELCLFGEAKQRDKGSKVGGTGLGKWTGSSMDDESPGTRIWKWENGQKCWNGPMRSATAYVTCGSETMVISADEPDTCRYVLRVESYVACDENFRSRSGL